MAKKFVKQNAQNQTRINNNSIMDMIIFNLFYSFIGKHAEVDIPHFIHVNINAFF